MNAVKLMWIGESSDTQRTEQRLVAVNASRLGVEVEKYAVELAHETAPPSVLVMRIAA